MNYVWRTHKQKLYFGALYLYTRRRLYLPTPRPNPMKDFYNKTKFRSWLVYFYRFIFVEEDGGKHGFALCESYLDSINLEKSVK